MKKKAVSALLCATMVAGMLAGCGKGSDSGTPSDTSKGDASNATESASSNLKDDGKVLNIYCWNEEFKSRITAVSYTHLRFFRVLHPLPCNPDSVR